MICIIYKHPHFLQAGNNWGSCVEQGIDGASLGCGPQETFRACSDIAIAGAAVKPAVLHLNPNK